MTPVEELLMVEMMAELHDAKHRSSASTLAECTAPLCSRARDAIADSVIARVIAERRANAI